MLFTVRVPFFLVDPCFNIFWCFVSICSCLLQNSIARPSAHHRLNERVGLHCWQAAWMQIISQSVNIMLRSMDWTFTSKVSHATNQMAVCKREISDIFWVCHDQTHVKSVKINVCLKNGLRIALFPQNFTKNAVMSRSFCKIQDADPETVCRT